MRRRPKGSGSITREGNGYSLRIRIAGHPVHESGFRTRGEAESRAAALRGERVHRRLGVAADPHKAPTLAVLAEPWLDRREETHAAGKQDRNRWDNHIAGSLGHLRPDEVGTAEIRALVESKRGELSPGTLGVVVAVLSALYEDLLERGLARANPARRLPRSLLRLLRSDHDPKTTPFLERLEDVRRVFLALPEPFNVAFAIGATAGLRTSEVFTLRWLSVDLDARRIVVSTGGRVTTKDREPRTAPILDPLHDVLAPWRLRHPGPGLVVPPSRGKRVDRSTPGPVLAEALRGLGLERDGLGWYECTRHTFASHWAMQGRSLRELQKILGHSSIAVTERYAHLAPDYWAPGVHGALPVSLTAGAGVVSPISQNTPDGAAAPGARPRKHGRKSARGL
jgi:integrase